MTKDYAFDWVDAFTDQTFGGNGCVVVHGADDISVADRTALVRETSLSECAYVVASDKADFGARYYLAEREILMAGHPTIATVTSLLDRGLVSLADGHAAFTLEVGSGVLPIEVAQTAGGARITMTQAAPEFGTYIEPQAVADLYGLGSEDILGQPQIVSTGTAYIIAVLRSKEALRTATLDTAKLDLLNTRIDGPFMEPFLVTLGGETETGDTFSRLLMPVPAGAEDPFTGSATGCMAAYLWHHGMIDTPRFVAEQGHWLGRPGQADVEVLGPPDAIAGVRVGGQGRVIMRGTLSL